jgi:transketolase
LEVEALAKRIGYSGSIETFALQDEFIHCYGTHADILAAHGLSVDYIVDQILSCLKPSPTSARFGERADS